MLSQTISTTVYLRPIEFDDIRYNIISKIKNDTTCTKEYGYPIEFVKLIDYASNTIAHTGMGVFNAIYEMKCLKPEIDQIYKCAITQIYAEGVFAKHGKLQVLVPATYMTDYEYNDKSFVRCNEKHPDYQQISVGDTVDIAITDLKYEHHCYQCIGKIII